MAEGGMKSRHPSRGEAAPAAAPELLHDTPLAPGGSDLPLPIDLPPTMFTGPGLLQLADLLPVMTAYVDRDEIFRFVNKPYAEWIGVPRKQIVGMSLRDLLGANYEAR